METKLLGPGDLHDTKGKGIRTNVTSRRSRGKRKGVAAFVAMVRAERREDESGTLGHAETARVEIKYSCRLPRGHGERKGSVYM